MKGEMVEHVKKDEIQSMRNENFELLVEVEIRLII